MKLLKTWMLLSVLLSVGCMKNDIQECSYNTMLTFRYNGDQMQDIFAGKIDGVTMYVFSSEGQLITTQELQQAELRRYQGVNLDLTPGDYRFVCWANAFANTKFSDQNNFHTARLYHPAVIGGQPILTNDPLYYAAGELNLSETGKLATEIPFVSAHINLEVYIRDLTDQAGRQLSVEVRNLLTQYDFAMNTTGARMAYQPVVAYDTTKEANVAKLSVLRFGNDNPIIIDINSPQRSGNPIVSVNLANFMKNNNIRVDGIQEATVSILVEIGGVGVTVTIPSWSEEEITPGK